MDNKEQANRQQRSSSSYFKGQLEEFIKKNDNKHFKSFSENSLGDNEKIICALTGSIGELMVNKGENKYHIGVLICTNNIVAFHKKAIFSNISRSIQIKNISSIDIDRTILGGKIGLRTSSDSIIFTTSLDSAKKFKLLVEKIRETNETSKTSIVAEDPIEKIRKLSQLKDDGIISEEEFEEKKKTLLKEI